MAKNNAELVMSPPMLRLQPTLPRGVRSTAFSEGQFAKPISSKLYGVHIFRCNPILRDNDLYAVEPLPDDIWVFISGTLVIISSREACFQFIASFNEVWPN